MSMNPARLERALLWLFIASGFAGLVYQAIWSHYLGLVLGHAAYAQTLVLGIFMGGMAAGAALVSARGGRWTGLIRAYAVVEVIIGLTALAFHWVFNAYLDLSQQTVLPALSSDAAVRAWQWGSAALLIAPQSILLGMTFPLMSGGYLRIAPHQDGEILGGLYFTNSIGAAFGALASTFLLLPWVGMPGAIATAGIINLLVGVVAWRIAAAAPAAAPAPVRTIASAPDQAPVAEPQRDTRRLQWLMLVGAAITGASSFVYEIGWIRMLSQALGTTVHAFELMLAAFIFGLAFGGLWVRKRSKHIDDPIRIAGIAQVLMGFAALLSLIVFAQSFRWVGFLVGILPKSDAGYHAYSLGSALISLAVMFPAAFFAGMTLPLFTMALLRRGVGEKSIGRIYAANTLGAIIGVALAVHVLIPLLGLRLAVTLAAFADIVLGLVLLRAVAERFIPRPYYAALAGTVVIGVVSLLFGAADPRALASGVFRHGRASLPEDNQVYFLRDGKTATVTYFQQGTIGTIATNGKPDASIEERGGQPTGDEYTMVMAASLPLGIHPNPERVAIIGWGSGLTTNTMLASTAPKVVDTIEIERAMYEGAENFGLRVLHAYVDPRSQLHIDDARTFFSTGRKTYDVIVSEPSNPWVSGVSSLFTRQFYRFLSNHLDEDGILVQWMQTYELDDPLFLTMVAALIEEYPYVEAYLTNTSDVIFVASHAPIGRLDMARLQHPAMQAELKILGMTSPGDYEVRRFANRSVLAGLVEMYGAKVHDDYYPVVALGAPKSRFRGDSVQSVMNLMAVGMPVLEMTGGRRPMPLSANVFPTAESMGANDHGNARRARQRLLGEGPGAGLEPSITQRIDGLRTGALQGNAWLDSVAITADFTLGYLPPDDLKGVWIDPQWVGEARSADPVVAAVMRAYDAAARRDAAAMYATGRAALDVLPKDAPPLLREQMLVIAMLGGIGQGKGDLARGMEERYGRDVKVSNVYYWTARSYLSAWMHVTGMSRVKAPTRD